MQFLLPISVLILVYIKFYNAKNIEYYGKHLAEPSYRDADPLIFRSHRRSNVKGTIADCLAGKLRCNFKVLKVNSKKYKSKKSSGYFDDDEDTTTVPPSTTTTAEPSTTDKKEFFIYKEKLEKDTAKATGNGTDAKMMSADVESDDLELKEWVLSKHKEGGKVIIKKISKEDFEKDKKRRKRRSKKNKRKSRKSRRKHRRSKDNDDDTTTAGYTGTGTTTTPISTSATTTENSDCAYWDVKSGDCRRRYKKSSRYLKPKIIRKRVLLNIKKSCYGGKKGCYEAPLIRSFGSKNYDTFSSGSANAIFRDEKYAYSPINNQINSLLPQSFHQPQQQQQQLVPANAMVLMPANSQPTMIAQQPQQPQQQSQQNQMAQPQSLSANSQGPAQNTNNNVQSSNTGTGSQPAPRLLYFNSGSSSGRNDVRPAVSAQRSDNPSAASSDLMPDHMPQSDIQIEGAEELS